MKRPEKRFCLMIFVFPERNDIHPWSFTFILNYFWTTLQKKPSQNFPKWRRYSWRTGMPRDWSSWTACMIAFVIFVWNQWNFIFYIIIYLYFILYLYNIIFILYYVYSIWTIKKSKTIENSLFCSVKIKIYDFPQSNLLILLHKQCEKLIKLWISVVHI